MWWPPTILLGFKARHLCRDNAAAFAKAATVPSTGISPLGIFVRTEITISTRFGDDPPPQKSDRWIQIVAEKAAAKPALRLR